MRTPSGPPGSLIATAAAAVMSASCVTRGPRTEPAPAPNAAAPSYSEAVAIIAERQRVDDSTAVPSGRSILLTHGAPTRRVYVLLHGFTDGPRQFEGVAQHLFADGANIYVPRLPHHAERVEPLRAIGRIRAPELARFADSTALIARGLGDTIVVEGLSAGGVLAGWIAQYHPEVSRVVLIAPAIAPGLLSDDRGAVVVLAAKLPNVQRMNAPLDSSRPENVPGISTRGLAELLRLGRRVSNAAGGAPPAVRDIALLLNERDRTVSETANLGLAQRWVDRGAAVAVYRFDLTAGLPHNLMELTDRGGNTAVVYPVVEALARGVQPPSTVKLIDVPCQRLLCRLLRGVRAK